MGGEEKLVMTSSKRKRPSAPGAFSVKSPIKHASLHLPWLILEAALFGGHGSHPFPLWFVRR